jgi:hypothetical protein
VGDALTTFWRNHREHWHTEVRHVRSAVLVHQIWRASLTTRSHYQTNPPTIHHNSLSYRGT